jgi:hypothetical protein
MNVNIQQALRSIVLLLIAVALTACGGNGGRNDNTIARSNNSTADDAAATLQNQQSQVQTQAATPSLTAPARASADVRLAWAAPLERTDGSALMFTDISGYQISYEDSKGRLRIAPKDTLLLEPAQSSYILEDLPADNYKINIFTVDTNGLISPASATITLQADQFPTS